MPVGGSFVPGVSCFFGPPRFSQRGWSRAPRKRIREVGSQAASRRGARPRLSALASKVFWDNQHLRDKLFRSGLPTFCAPLGWRPEMFSATLLTAFITVLAWGFYGAYCPSVTCFLFARFHCFQSSPTSLFGPPQDVSHDVLPRHLRWRDYFAGGVGAPGIFVSRGLAGLPAFPPPGAWVQVCSSQFPCVLGPCPRSSQARSLTCTRRGFARFCGPSRVWPRRVFFAQDLLYLVKGPHVAV